jgi:hypothetical protein
MSIKRIKAITPSKPFVGATQLKRWPWADRATGSLAFQTKTEPEDACILQSGQERDYVSSYRWGRRSSCLDKRAPLATNPKTVPFHQSTR